MEIFIEFSRRFLIIGNYIFFGILSIVLIGGSLGSYFGATKYDPQTIQKVMGIVIIIAILFLMRKIF